MSVHAGGRGPGHMARVQRATASALAISGTAPAAWQNAAGYSFTPTVSGGSGTRSFARTGSALPAGLSFSTVTGAITGTPTAIANTPGIIITVTDSTGSQAVTVSINVVAVLAISGTPGTTGTQGSAYTFTPTVTGGVGTKVYTINTSPPPGIGLNSSTGVLAGTPTMSGTASGLIISVTDDVGTKSLASFNLAIASNLALSGTPGTATNGSAYTFTPTTTGGTAPYSYASTGTALPTGLSISSTTGTISGTPTVNGTTTNCNITVTDSLGTAVSLGAFSLVVNSPGAAPVNVSVPVITGTAQVGQTVTASDGNWSNSPSGYTGQWYKAGVPVSGATAHTYTFVTGDVGATFTYDSTASNGFGSATATSAATAAVTAAGVTRLVTAGANMVGTALVTQEAAEQYKEFPVVAGTGGLTTLQIGFARGYIPQTSSLAETSLTASRDVRAAYKHPDGSFRSFLFGGSAVGTVPANWNQGEESAFYYSDVLTVPSDAAAMTLLKLWSLEIGTASAATPYNDPVNGGLISTEGSVWSTSAAANTTPRSLTGGTATGTGNNSKYSTGPLIIRGVTDGEPWFITMDSTGAYAGVQSNHWRNDVEPAIGPTRAFYDAAVAGDAEENFPGNYYMRAEIAANCKGLANILGVNSFRVKSATAVSVLSARKRFLATHFKGYRLINTTVSPVCSNSGGLSATRTLTGASISGNVLTVPVSGTNGSLTVAMKLNVTGSPLLQALGTGGTTGTGADGTYQLSSSTGNGLTPTTATAQWADPAGLDQNPVRASELTAWNAALSTNFPSSPIYDRYSVLNNGAAAGCWAGTGVALGITIDGTHFQPLAYTNLIAALSSGLAANLVTAPTVTIAQPSIDLTKQGTAPTFSGGYCTSGVFTQDENLVSAASKGMIRFIYNSTYSAGSHTLMSPYTYAGNVAVFWFRTLAVTSTGAITFTNNSANAATTVVPTNPLNDGNDHVVEIWFDGFFAFVRVDGVYLTWASGTGTLAGSTSQHNFVHFQVTSGRGKVKNLEFWSYLASPTVTSTPDTTSYVGSESTTNRLMVRYTLADLTTGHIGIAGKLFA